MSHFTRIKTQIVEREFLLQALQDLDCTYEVGEDLKIGGFGMQRTQAEIKVHIPSLSREVGFRKSGETYEMVADFWGQRFNRQEFQRRLMQRYAYHTAIAKLQEQGFDLVTEETQKDGQLHLTLRRAI